MPVLSIIGLKVIAFFAKSCLVLLCKIKITASLLNFQPHNTDYVAVNLIFFALNYDRPVGIVESKEVLPVLSDEQREQKKQELLEKCFELFVEQGLENTSLNELVAYCNVHKSTMYSYFGSKDEIVIECAKMHMLELDEMFSNVFKNPPKTLKEVLQRGFEKIAEEKSKLRFIYQVISSPLCGEQAQKELSSIYMKYVDYSGPIAKMYNVDEAEFRTFFILFLSTMHDYCMWGNEFLAREKLVYIYNKVAELDKNKVN